MSFRKAVCALALLSASVPAAFASNGASSAERETSLSATEISYASEGVSMRTAKLSNLSARTRQMEIQPDASISVNGVPMVVAKRPHFSAQARWSATLSDTGIRLTGAPLVVAKRPVNVI